MSTAPGSRYQVILLQVLRTPYNAVPPKEPPRAIRHRPSAIKIILNGIALSPTFAEPCLAHPATAAERGNSQYLALVCCKPLRIVPQANLFVRLPIIMLEESPCQTLLATQGHRQEKRVPRSVAQAMPWASASLGFCFSTLPLDHNYSAAEHGHPPEDQITVYVAIQS
jgi:hypothetical protein